MVTILTQVPDKTYAVLLNRSQPGYPVDEVARDLLMAATDTRPEIAAATPEGREIGRAHV
jgi:hypothetical protein